MRSKFLCESKHSLLRTLRTADRIQLEADFRTLAKRRGEDAFEQSGRAKVVATAQTHPNADDARRDALEMLRDHPEINVLIALNEPSGVGAARAVHQMQRSEDLWLAAFDSNLETVDALQNGAVDAQVVQNSYSMGYFGVQSAYRLHGRVPRRLRRRCFLQRSRFLL